MNTENLLTKLTEAFNSRDIDRVAECFDPNYDSEQPVHPARRFRGKDQVIKNWSANFSEMPDFSATVLRHVTEADIIWIEWEWQGTRGDQSRLHMRGVTIFGLKQERIEWGRLYMEPVESNGAGIDDVIKQVMIGKKDS
jgi:hypothetical protein